MFEVTSLTILFPPFWLEEPCVFALLELFPTRPLYKYSSHNSGELFASQQLVACHSCMLLLCGQATGKRCTSSNAIDHRTVHAAKARIQHTLKTGGWVGWKFLVKRLVLYLNLDLCILYVLSFCLSLSLCGCT